MKDDKQSLHRVVIYLNDKQYNRLNREVKQNKVRLSRAAYIRMRLFGSRDFGKLDTEYV